MPQQTTADIYQAGYESQVVSLDIGITFKISSQFSGTFHPFENPDEESFWKRDENDTFRPYVNESSTYLTILPNHNDLELIGKDVPVQYIHQDDAVYILGWSNAVPYGKTAFYYHPTEQMYEIESSIGYDFDADEVLDLPAVESSYRVKNLTTNAVINTEKPLNEKLGINNEYEYALKVSYK